MKADIWGPAGWLFLHSITLNYPENPTQLDKDNYSVFFASIQNTLPCEKCKEHYKNNIYENPIRLNSREDLVKWLIEIHNEVNKNNNKPIFTYDMFIDKYSKIYDDNDHGIDKLLLLVIIIIFFLLILYASS